MEVWLSDQAGKERLRLPVLPSSFEVAVGNLNTRVNINEVGNINLIGKSDLKEMVLESFFPAREYYFAEYVGFPRPYECVDMIETWRKSSKPIRLIITDTPVNIMMVIEEFAYGERDGTGDVYFTLELAEYVFVRGAKEPPRKEGYEQPQIERPSNREIPKEYIVKDGDNLLTIAKRLTGNSANYSVIAAKNNLKDPNLIYPGQKLVV